jgi:GNAT superfamily N-acetyltransferase
MANIQTPFDLADVAVVSEYNPRTTKDSTLKATWRGKEIGVIEFEDMDRSTWKGMDFHITYLKVARRHQGQGVGRLLLEAVKAQIPTHTTKVAFTCVTSQGVARLIERVFGRLYDYEYHAKIQAQQPFRWASVDEMSPQANLRFSRGPNGYANWPMELRIEHGDGFAGDDSCESPESSK